MATTPQGMAAARKAARVKDVSIDFDRAQVMADPRINIFNVLDGTSGQPPNPHSRFNVRRYAMDEELEHLSASLKYLAAKQPGSGNWTCVKNGRATMYTHSHMCQGGLQNIFNQVMTRRNDRIKREHKEWFKVIDKRVRSESGFDAEGLVISLALLKTHPATEVQDVHLDNTFEGLDSHPSLGKSAVLAASQAGAYLLVFPGVWYADVSAIDQEPLNPPIDGVLLYIPFGWCVMFDHDVLHAGGMLSRDSTDGNLRLHYYITPGGRALPVGNNNAYKNGEKFSRDFHVPLSAEELSSLFQLPSQN